LWDFIEVEETPINKRIMDKGLQQNGPSVNRIATNTREDAVGENVKHANRK